MRIILTRSSSGQRYLAEFDPHPSRQNCPVNLLPSLQFAPTRPSPIVSTSRRRMQGSNNTDLGSTSASHINLENYIHDAIGQYRRLRRI